MAPNDTIQPHLKQRMVREIMDNASISRTRAEVLAARLIRMVVENQLSTKQDVSGLPG